ncbi:hypothetical protein FA95DRAFT_645962 [Auriscalpium vulgare]|uniref:Uncharacterized protein n=1 Tax=Auriscalpium vulgare TaxID=40419 RepID=A0ACB8S2P9_9AGAM|nr:hypothetical protein FA95DRAFT_645962 [Auriscalpium vulgare]
MGDRRAIYRAARRCSDGDGAPVLAPWPIWTSATPQICFPAISPAGFLPLLWVPIQALERRLLQLELWNEISWCPLWGWRAPNTRCPCAWDTSCPRAAEFLAVVALADPISFPLDWDCLMPYLRQEECRCSRASEDKGACLGLFHSIYSVCYI